MRNYFLLASASICLMVFAIGCSNNTSSENEKPASADTVSHNEPPLDTTAPLSNPKNDSLKYIYLTFDDGPLNGSENIDSVILGEQLRVNVFLVGRNAQANKRMDAYFKMYEKNPFIELYNHSFSHANNKYNLFYTNPQNVLADIKHNDSVLSLEHKIVRLPGRNMWRIGKRFKNDGLSGASSADLLAQNGYKLYGWDLEWMHNGATGAPIQPVDKLYKQIVTRLNNNSTFTPGHLVLLIHDEMFKNKTEELKLKQLIDSLRSNKNYVFDYIRNYPDTLATANLVTNKIIAQN